MLKEHLDKHHPIRTKALKIKPNLSQRLRRHTKKVSVHSKFCEEIYKGQSEDSDEEVASLHGARLEIRYKSWESATSRGRTAF